MTIVEVRGRGGQLLERVRHGGARIRVGRAFDNDVVLEDPHVSPHHLTLDCVEGGWRFEDLDSLNGVRRQGRRVRQGVLRSGETLRLGNVTLRVYAEDHAVAPAVRLGDVETRLAALGRLPIWLGLLVAYLVTSAVDLLWSTIQPFEPWSAVGSLSLEVLLFGVVAGFWAGIGRVLRHQGQFFSHLSLWLGVMLASQAATFAAQGVAYNLGSRTLEEALDTLLSVALLAFAVWGSLTLATQASARRRVAGAAGVAAAVVAIAWSDTLQFDGELSSAPEYYGRVAGPRMLVARPVPEAELARALPALFDRADAARQEALAEKEEARGRQTDAEPATAEGE
jgi:hypothetical protein